MGRRLRYVYIDAVRQKGADVACNEKCILVLDLPAAELFSYLYLVTEDSCLVSMAARCQTQILAFR